MRAGWTVVFGLTLLAPAAAGEPQPTVLAPRLPAGLAGWQKTGVENFRGRELYRFIDGGAELYLSFSPRVRLEHVTYQKGDERIELDVFDLQRPENAFGVFSLTREKVEQQFGQGSEYRDGLLVFWKGRYYFSLTAYPETAEKREVMFQLARFLEQAAGADGGRPPILERLYAEGLRPESVRYFRHPAWLSAACALDEGNPLQLGPGGEAALADYQAGYRLLVVRYPGGAQAARAEKSFRRWLTAAPFAAQESTCRHSAAAAVGPWLVVVLQAREPAQAGEILKTILAEMKK